MPQSSRYLIEDHAIYEAPSLTVIREMTKALRHLQSGLIAIYGLQFAHETIGPLRPNAEQTTDPLMTSVTILPS